MFKCHGVVAPTRRLFASTTCGACLRDFHTFGKMKEHLRYSKKCRTTLGGRSLYHQPAPGFGSTVDRSLVEQHGGFAPSAIGEGPQPVDPVQLDVDHTHDALREAFLEVLLAAHDEIDLASGFKRCIDAHVVSWTQLQDTLYNLKSNLTNEELDLLEVNLSVVASAIDYILAPCSWAFLTDYQEVTADQDFYTCDAWLADIASWTTTPWVPSSQIPRWTGKHRYVLHAFAGRRRRGDIQFFLDAARDGKDYVVHTLSVDVILDTKYCDLSRKDIQHFWLRAIDDRFVVGFIGGPPCNTWSLCTGEGP